MDLTNRTWHPTSMEGDVQPRFDQLSSRHLRSVFSSSNEHQLLPHELCDSCARDFVPKSAMASDIVDRTHGVDGGVVVPLLPPWRTSNDFSPCDR
ncbi:hypothetical protein LXL04_038591 [Taraxacum kok-saghyz]